MFTLPLVSNVLSHLINIATKMLFYFFLIRKISAKQGKEREGKGRVGLYTNILGT